jgi:ribosomal protein S10
MTVASSNRNSIRKFFLFFFYNKKMSINTLKRYYQKKRRKKFLTILKSPHVNKTAQEQFEQKIYTKQVTVYSSQRFQYTVLLKKISGHLFPDVKIKLRFHMNRCTENPHEIFNPSNLNLDFFRDKNPKDLGFKTKTMIEAFDVYGELVLRDEPR